MLHGERRTHRVVVGLLRAGLLLPLLRLLGVRRAVRPTAVTNSPLTMREQEILSLVAAGLPDREIAARLGLSRWTVLSAVGSATAKLGATTRAAAVAAMT